MYIFSGLITTTAVTHASPAGIFAHSANRNWESDERLLKDGGDPAVCMDIAKQLIYNPVGYNLNVVMGGGRQEFIPIWQNDSTGNQGKRTDNINLIDVWKDKHSKHFASFIQTKDELLKVCEFHHLYKYAMLYTYAYVQ